MICLLFKISIFYEDDLHVQLRPISRVYFRKVNQFYVAILTKY